MHHVSAYDLELDVRPPSLEFHGRVTLHLEGFAGGTLVLNAAELKVGSVEVGSKAHTFALAPEAEELRISDVPSGSHKVTVAFSGSALAQGMTGMYRSPWGDSVMLTTQFEATGARRVFPCLDEPAQKSVFRLTLRVPSDMQGRSNTPAASVTEEGASKVFVFAPTPKMSTYLLYAAVGKLEETAATHGGVRIAAISSPGRSAAGAEAIGEAGRILDFYGRYYGIPYPLPKLDLLALPAMGAGAMENWGAITFQERLILLDRTTSTSARHVAVTVIAHEIAHQWFGNYTTMKWWDDLWLNESFATFVAYKAVDALHPDWDVWADFFTSSNGSSAAYLFDSLSTTHPIHVPVKTPDEINGIFDEISYGKGGCVLRMIEAYLGEEKFRAGVSAYLSSHAYGNATGADLWRSLEEVSRVPVSAIMEAWVERSGHPFVRAKLVGEELVLEQALFRYLGPSPEVAPWPIPINLRVDGKPHRVLLEGRSAKVPVGQARDIVVNDGGYGFYRTAYDGALLERILGRFPSLAPQDRYTVLSDLDALLLAGEVGPGRFLDFIRACADERAPTVLTELLSQYRTFRLLLHDRPAFLAPYEEIIRRGQERLGLEAGPTDAPTDLSFRGQFAISRSAFDPAFAERMAKRWPQWDQEVGDLRLTVAASYSRVGGQAAHRDLLARYERAVSDNEATQLGSAMVAAPDPALVLATIHKVMDPKASLSRSMSILLASVANPKARQVVWDWFVQSAPAFLELLKGSAYPTLVMQWSLPYLALGHLEEARRFVAELKVPEAQSGGVRALELLETYERLRRKVAAA